MNILNRIFFKVFTLIYPFIHNHLVSYLLIIFIFSGIGWLIWQVIARYKNTNTLSKKLFKLILFGAEIGIFLFVAWLIIVHFHTFRMLK